MTDDTISGPESALDPTSYNDELWEARRLAIGVAKDYAADEGIALMALDDECVPTN